MRNKKFQLNWYQANDSAAMEEKLEKMAAKGWLLDRINNWGFHYRKAAPQTVRYTVTYFPKASIFDGELIPQQQTYADFCAAAGWEFVTAWGPMQFFRSTMPDPVPIETDEEEKLQTIHRSMLKTWVLSYSLLLVVWLLNLATRLQSLRYRPISILSSNKDLVFLLFLICFVLFLAVFLADYFLWYLRSKKAVAHAGACLRPHTRARLAASTAMLVIACLVIFTMLADISSPGMALIWICSFGGIALMMALSQGTMALMKKRGCSRSATRTVFILAVLVLSIAYAAGLTAMARHLSDRGLMASSKRTPAYTIEIVDGWTQDIYRDSLPLTLEDLGYTVTEEDHCSYEATEDRSLLLHQSHCIQREWGKKSSLPELEYRILHSPLSPVRNYLLHQLTDSFLPTEDPRWGADEVFAYNYNTADYSEYILVYGETIVYFSLSAPLRQQDVTLIRQSLGI